MALGKPHTTPVPWVLLWGINVPPSRPGRGTKAPEQALELGRGHASPQGSRDCSCL